jgi:hypothetical protein
LRYTVSVSPFLLIGSSTTKVLIERAQLALSNWAFKWATELATEWVSHAEPELTCVAADAASDLRLAVGDVLALPVSVHQALRVTGPDGVVICNAHLGNLAGFHAVEVIPSTSN